MAGTSGIRPGMACLHARLRAARYHLYIENLIVILETAKSGIIGAGLDILHFTQAIGAIRGWSARPDAAMWFSISWAEGIQP